MSLIGYLIINKRETELFSCLKATLRCIEFAVTGPVAGTIAARIQSICYKGAVAADSLFARAQAIAMRA